MTNYIRVIPRDLFNESKLLKCLGALYIESEHHEGLSVERAYHAEGSRDGFEIVQDQDSGAIYCRDVVVTYRGRVLHCYTGLNARGPYPMYADHEDETVAVFTVDGRLSEEFLAIGTVAA
jgi:hypothetical protein